MTQGATVMPVPIALYPEASPMTAFQNYFASELMGLTPVQMAQAAAENKSVLDFAAGGFTSLRSRVPTSQVSKVAGSLDAIRQLEMNLASSASMTGSCMPPAFAGGPLSPAGITSCGTCGSSPVDTTTYPGWKQMKEIITTMFKCHLQPVHHFTFRYGHSNIP